MVKYNTSPKCHNFAGNSEDRYCNNGGEGIVVVTSVTPLIARVDSADLAGLAGVHFLPHHSMCVPPEAACSVEEDDHP